MQSPVHVTPLWSRLALALACAGAIVAALLLVGPRSSSPQAIQRVVSAQRGVVVSTVTGSGTLAPARQINLNFRTSGTLQKVYVSPGQHVYAGQLLATLDPSQANVSVEQAQASVASAQAQLAAAESASSASGTTGASGGSPATAAGTSAAAQAGASSARPSAVAPGTRRTNSGGQTNNNAKPNSNNGTTASTNTTATSRPATSTQTPAQRAASIASAQAAVDSAEVNLQSAENSAADTRLFAPVAGTVASISDTQAGDQIGGGGSSSTATGNSTAASSASSGRGGSGGAGGASSPSSGSSTSSTGSAGSPAFIVLVDLSGMNLTVPFSESDISKLRVGQPASVTVNALPGTELQAHITAIDTLATSNSGVVSYNVTFALDQLSSQLRPGMTASAQVITSEVSGAVTVPSAAISGGSVTVLRNGHHVAQPVVTGVVGDSSTQVLSGLAPGDQVVITTSLNLGSNTTGFGGARAGGGLGGGALGGGGAFGGPGGGGGGFARRAAGGG